MNEHLVLYHLIMKKLVVFWLISLISLVGYTQQHLQIMSIPIDGSIEDFKQKLIQKGFILEPREVRTDIVRHEEFYGVKHGTYSGEPIESIRLMSTPRSNTVFGVVIDLKFDSKSGGELFFNRVKNVAEDKYGVSSTPTELVWVDSQPKGVGLRCFYIGHISISYPTGSCNGDNTWYVTICYIDRMNYNIIAINEQMDLKKERDSDI